MVGVEPAVVRPHDLVVTDDELEMEVLGKLQAVEDLAVPVPRPPLVHDLGFDLRDEVLRFLVDDRQQILLPFREKRVVVPDEDQQILLGRRRNPLEVGLASPRGGGCAWKGSSRRRARRRSAADARIRRSSFLTARFRRHCNESE